MPISPQYHNIVPHTRGVEKVLQVDMLDWKTFQYLYTNKTHISLELMWS